MVIVGRTEAPIPDEQLGRHLAPEETVHHRNGVRDDNRPQNLELWTRPQPAGIRASDALEWAHEVIRRYEGLAHLQQRSDDEA
jgi:HNH endonuclease